jgi:hypothetical protein
MESIRPKLTWRELACDVRIGSSRSPTRRRLEPCWRRGDAAMDPGRGRRRTAGGRCERRTAHRQQSSTQLGFVFGAASVRARRGGLSACASVCVTAFCVHLVCDFVGLGWALAKLELGRDVVFRLISVKLLFFG